MRTAQLTRERWLELGRQAGEQEADLRSETGEAREQRIRLALTYHAWEWDGKPTGYEDRYAAEFGGVRPALQEALRPSGPDWKGGKPDKAK